MSGSKRKTLFATLLKPLRDSRLKEELAVHAHDNKLAVIWKQTLRKKLHAQKRSILFRKYFGSALVNFFSRKYSTDDSSHSVTFFIAKLTDPQSNTLAIGDFRFPVPFTRSDQLIYAPALQDFYAQYSLGLDTTTDYALYSLLSEGPAEFGEIRMRPGDIVIDAGANIGDFSLLAAAKVMGKGRVYAFEPIISVVMEHLRPTLQINSQLAETITIIEAGLADKTEVRKIFVNDNFMDEASLIGTKRTTGKPEAIKVVTLDSFVKQEELSRVDFIKADIEGAERLLLVGAQETLKRFAPCLSIANYHLSDDSQVLPRLILKANPNYRITQKWKKLLAYVPKQ